MSGTHGVFQHRTGYFFTILEEDFCEVFKAPGVNEVCRAYITSILEHLTNKQFEATGSEKELWVFMSLPEMARRMRHACSERTIHKEIQGMIKDGYIEKRRAVGKATMEYKLNLKRIRKALEALPDGQSCKSATYDLANLQEPSSNSARSTLQNYKNDLAELQPRIPIDIPVEEPKITEEGSATSAEDRNAHPLINLEMKRVEKRETNPRMPAINLKGQSDHGTSHNSSGDSGVPGGLREDLPRSGRGDTSLVEQKPGASPLPSAVSRAGDGGHGDASAQASSQQPIATQGLPAPAASAELPQVSVQQGAMAKCDTKEIQRRINEHRCYALEEQVEIIRERKAIKSWCNLHTLEEFGLVMSGAKKDKYWGKQENYYRIGGLTLLKITPEILARQRAPLPMAANGNGHHSDMEGLVTHNGQVLWQGQWMTEEEADKTGFNGGFGLYK